jgi:hypothetical protein
LVVDLGLEAVMEVQAVQAAVEDGIQDQAVAELQVKEILVEQDQTLMCGVAAAAAAQQAMVEIHQEHTQAQLAVLVAQELHLLFQDHLSHTLVEVEAVL